MRPPDLQSSLAHPRGVKGLPAPIYPGAAGVTADPVVTGGPSADVEGLLVGELRGAWVVIGAFADRSVDWPVCAADTPAVAAPTMTKPVSIATR